MTWLHDSPDGLSFGEGQIVIGLGVVDGDGESVYLITPASEVSQSLYRHANMSF